MVEKARDEQERKRVATRTRAQPHSPKRHTSSGCGLTPPEFLPIQLFSRQPHHTTPHHNQSINPVCNPAAGIPLNMSTTGIHLVDKLPLRLRNFLARYPPQIYSAQVAPRPAPPGPEQLAQLNDTQNNQTPVATSPTELENAPEKSPYHPNRDAKGHPRPDPSKYYSPSRALLYNNPDYPNPFLPQKNMRNGKWLGPRLGLRQQADLVKLAVKYNIEGLLPPGKKSTEFKETKRAERGGLAVKGTGVGQKVKGHKWERTMEARLEDRRKAMVEMPEMVRLWKQVSFFLPSFLFLLLAEECGC